MADRRGTTTDDNADDSSDALTIQVEGVTSTHLPGHEPVFGRGAEIDVDDNPYLHRELGRFVHQGGWWWLQNLGTNTVLHLIEPGSGALSRVPPKAQTVLAYPHQIIRFDVGRTRYQLEANQSPRSTPSVEYEPTSGGAVTIDLTELPVNAEQRQLLVVLSEARLRDPVGTVELPSNREVAERLGWSLTKVNRKLDWLCDRLARQGISGMKEVDRRATRRRERLVEHVINTGLVSAADLAELD